MSIGSAGERFEAIHPVFRLTQDPPLLQAWDMENFPESTPEAADGQLVFRGMWVAASQNIGGRDPQYCGGIDSGHRDPRRRAMLSLRQGKVEFTDTSLG
jgi:hypothetical protein